MSNLVRHYSELWKLSDIHKLKETPTGQVYRVESKYGASVLKIFTDLGVKDELGGTVFLEACSGDGTVKLYEHDDKAQLIEYLPGENLYSFSKDGKENEATTVFIDIIKKIHSHEAIAKEKLTTLSYLFKIFDRVSSPQNLSEIFDRAKAMSKELLETQVDEVLLHGDLHHENVLKNSNGVYVCFDPKGMIGDPSYELGTTLKNPWGYPKISQDIETFKSRAKTFSEELQLPYDRIIGFAFVHLCLSIGWAIEDGGDYPHQEVLVRQVDLLVK